MPGRGKPACRPSCPSRSVLSPVSLQLCPGRPSRDLPGGCLERQVNSSQSLEEVGLGELPPGEVEPSEV